MDPLTITALATQAATGVGQLIKGIGQEGRAKRIARNNPRPVYKIPEAIGDNQAIAESRASRGLSGQAIDLYRKDSDRKITSSIDAILKGGGSVNNIGDLYSATNDGVAKMALLDDEMRSRNLKGLVDQNNIKAEYDDKAFQVNYYAPYADKAQAAAALQKQGNDNLWKGINTFGSAVSNTAVARGYEKEGKDVFGNKISDKTPAPYQSSIIQNAPSRTQTIAARYPGFMGGRRAGIATLDPVWDEDAQAYIDPQTGQPIN